MKTPTIEEQKELLSINTDGKEEIQIPFSKDVFKIGWMKESTKEKLSLLELNDGIEVASSDTERDVKKRARFMAKAASLIILNGIKANMFHWVYWRYLYYIKGYSSNQLLPIIQLGKKKAVQRESLLGSILVSQMKNTNIMMTAEEVAQLRSQAGLSSE